MMATIIAHSSAPMLKVLFGWQVSNPCAISKMTNVRNNVHIVPNMKGISQIFLSKNFVIRDSIAITMYLIDVL
jgi:hypothetical protein